MSFWAEALIRLLARPSRADDVIGDLNEMRGRRLEQHGRWVAEWLNLLGVIDMSIALVGQRFRSARKIRGPQGQEFYPIHMQVYRTRGWRMRRHIDDWSRDLMQAARSLRRARGFTFVTVTTLALAIG